MLRSFICIPMILVLLILLSACGGARQDSMNMLDRCLRSYHNNIQFKQKDDAVDFVSAEKQPEFYQSIENLMATTNVSSYTIRSVSMNEAADTAEVFIIREIYDNSSYEVRSENITQKWGKKGTGWILIGGGY